MRQFVAEHNPLTASRIAEDLLQRIEQLRLFPEIGKNVEPAKVEGSIRDFIFGKYIVRYSVQSDTLIILRIWHHYEAR